MLVDQAVNEKPNVVKVEEKTFEISDKTMGLWNEDDLLEEPPEKRKVNIDKSFSPRKNLKSIE